MAIRFAAAALVAALRLSAATETASPALAEAAAAARAGDRRGALERLDAARKEKGSAEERERVALLYAELKEYAAAKSLLTELILEAPRDARLRLLLATVVARAGDRGATLTALAEARARNPCAVDRQRMAFLHQDFKDYGPARELLDELIKESPGNLSVRLDRASLAAQTADAGTARAQLAAAASLTPGPEDRRRMAALYHDLREYGRARALLDALIADFPGDARLRLSLAESAAHSDDRAAAILSLAAARARTRDRDILGRVASVYLELREPGPARAVLADIVGDAPRSARARIELARFDARRGDRAAALESLAAASALEPDLQEQQAMSLLYEDLGEHATARRMADALAAEQPRDPQLRLNLAFFAADAGDRGAALAFLRETRERSPDPDDRRRMALLYERLGETDKARALRAEAEKISR